jgi:hypothetical protein
MPLLLDLLIPLVLTLVLLPVAKKRIGVWKLAGLLGFVVGAGFSALFVAIEFHPKVKSIEAIVSASLAVLLSGVLVGSFHSFLWFAGARVVDRIRARRSSRCQRLSRGA